MTSISMPSFDASLRNGQQFLGVELKIRRLPVIDENRTLFILIFTADQCFLYNLWNAAVMASKPLSV